MALFKPLPEDPVERERFILYQLAAFEFMLRDASALEIEIQRDAAEDAAGLCTMMRDPARFEMRAAWLKCGPPGTPVNEDTDALRAEVLGEYLLTWPSRSSGGTKTGMRLGKSVVVPSRDHEAA